MNFSKLSPDTFLGKLLRLPLRLVPDRAVVPILQGEMRGLRWIVGASDHGCWLGSYEQVERRVVAANIQSGSIVYDIGAHVGYYSLLASRLVGPEGQVHAFEPLPENLGYLQRHIELNSIANIYVHPVAVSSASGSTNFQIGPSRSMGKMTLEGELVVRVISLDDAITAGELPPPDFLKIDVEGAELEVIQGAMETLQERHPSIFLETHSEELHHQSIATLSKLGYKCDPIETSDRGGTGDILATFTGEGWSELKS